MATFQSRAEVKQACHKLLDLEKKTHHLIQSSEELPVDQIEKQLKKQSELIAEIDFDSGSSENLPDEISRPLNKFMELRKENKKFIENSMNKIEQQLDSLDQSSKLMRHYMQGGMKDSGSTSTRIDRDA